MISRSLLLLLALTVCGAPPECDIDYTLYGMDVCTGGSLSRDEVKIVVDLTFEEAKIDPGETKRILKDTLLRVLAPDEDLVTSCEYVQDGIAVCDVDAAGVTYEYGKRIIIEWDDCIARSSLVHELIHVLEERVWGYPEVEHPPEHFGPGGTVERARQRAAAEICNN